MIDNFSQILRRMPTGDTYSCQSHYGGVIPFKVQVNFDILVFEGQIDADVINKWLNFLEGFFWFVIFPIGKILPFHSSKSPPTSSTSGKPAVS